MSVWLARALVAVALSALAGCSNSTDKPPAPDRTSPDRPAPLPATTPYVVMTGAGTGWAVWRSGEAWVLLRTTDAFAHVANATPVAVPTDGGLVGSFTARQAGVAVEASERLLHSPVLTSSVLNSPAAGSPAWLPQELPDAVADARGALTVGPGPVSAVTSPAGGTLVTRTAGGWRRRTDAHSLAPSGDLRLDSVLWSDRAVGWLTGHGSPGVRAVFVSRDAGSSWTPVPVTTASTVAALAPCGSGQRWLLPILDTNHHMTVFRTVDGGRSWAAGAPVTQPAGVPAWGCHDNTVWAEVRTRQGDRIATSPDGGRSWSDRGPAPADLTSLVPTGDGRGVATTGGSHGRIFAVSESGSRFTVRVLPSWVAQLGAHMPGN